MKTIVIILASTLVACGNEESIWSIRLKEGIAARERMADKIERDWQFQKDTEQRERIHRDEVAQRESIFKKETEQREQIQKEIEDVRRNQEFIFNNRLRFRQP